MARPASAAPRVLLTRPADRVRGFAHGCRRLGLEPVPLACLDIETLSPDRVPDTGVVVFTSVHAVAGATRDHPLPWPGTRALAIGAATRDALVAAGQPPVAAPVAPYTSEALLTWMTGPDGPCLAGGVTIVKGVGGRTVLADGLRAAGVDAASLAVYRRVRPTHDAGTLDAALVPVPDIVCTTSDEVLDNLVAIAGHRAPALLRAPFVVNGERAAAHARARGVGGAVLVARVPGDAGQLDCLDRWLRARPGHPA